MSWDHWVESLKKTRISLAVSSLARTESRGAHSRTDFPKRDDQDWLLHTLAHKEEGQGPILSYKPVYIDWDRYPPQERKY